MPQHTALIVAKGSTVLHASQRAQDLCCNRQGPVASIESIVEQVTAAMERHRRPGAMRLRIGRPPIAIEAVKMLDLSRRTPVTVMLLTDDLVTLPECEEPVLLTPREREVVEALAEGLTNKEIAARLCLSEQTVKGHVRHIMDKSHAMNRTQILAQLLAGLFISSS